MPKRANNEGSIHRRKQGGWSAQYTVWTAEGRKRKTLYAKTKEGARQKLAKAIADRDGGMVFEDENLTLSEFLDRWLKDSVKGSVRQSTYESYRRQINRYITPASISQVKLKKLNPGHVQHLYRSLLDRGLSARTVQYTHAVLRRALKQAMRWGMVPRNVCDAADPPQVRRGGMQPLSADQARRFLQAAGETSNRFNALYVLAIHTGMRPGELLALRWEDVDLDTASLRVNRALSDGEFNAPKTAKSRRRIDLSARSVNVLREHRKRQLEERLKVAGLWRDHGLVFSSTVGTPLDYRNVVRSFKALLIGAGLPNIRFYDLRHTCATLLLSRNVHPKYVQELLGHASIALTLDTYSHVLPGMDSGISGMMDEALG